MLKKWANFFRVNSLEKASPVGLIFPLDNLPSRQWPWVLDPSQNASHGIWVLGPNGAREHNPEALQGSRKRFFKTLSQGESAFVIPQTPVRIALAVRKGNMRLSADAVIRFYPRYGLQELLQSRPLLRQEDLAAILTSFFAGVLECAQLSLEETYFPLYPELAEDLRTRFSNQLIRKGMRCESLEAIQRETVSEVGSRESQLSQESALRWQGLANRCGLDSVNKINHSTRETMHVLKATRPHLPKTWKWLRHLFSQKGVDRQLRSHLRGLLDRNRGVFQALAGMSHDDEVRMQCGDLDLILSNVVTSIEMFPSVETSFLDFGSRYWEVEERLEKLEAVVTAAEAFNLEVERLVEPQAAINIDQINSLVVPLRTLERIVDQSRTAPF